MNIVFWGSDDFAAVHLQALADSKHRITGCVTQPDKARGRGWKVSASPVKACAEKNKIPVFTPENLKVKPFLKDLQGLGGDVFVVIAYGKYLPKEVLSMPRKYPVNVHSSLLPHYRGAAPINWAIINGERETGISVMRITAEMDAGEVFAQERIPVAASDTAVTLRAKMARISPLLLLRTLDAISDDTCTLTPQDPKAVTWAPKLTKEMGKIVWKKGAEEIRNLIRGLLPWPGAYTFYKRKMLKVLEADVIDLEDAHAGKVVKVSREGLVVATGRGALRIRKVHLAASKPMDAHSFIVGHKLEAGFKFE